MIVMGIQQEYELVANIFCIINGSKLMISLCLLEYCLEGSLYPSTLIAVEILEFVGVACNVWPTVLLIIICSDAKGSNVGAYRVCRCYPDPWVPLKVLHVRCPSIRGISPRSSSGMSINCMDSRLSFRMLNPCSLRVHSWSCSEDFHTPFQDNLKA